MIDDDRPTIYPRSPEPTSAVANETLIHQVRFSDAAYRPSPWSRYDTTHPYIPYAHSTACPKCVTATHSVLCGACPRYLDFLRGTDTTTDGGPPPPRPSRVWPAGSSPTARTDTRWVPPTKAALRRMSPARTEGWGIGVSHGRYLESCVAELVRSTIDRPMPYTRP